MTCTLLLCLLFGCVEPVDFNPFRNFRHVEKHVDPFDMPAYYGPMPAHPIASECAVNDVVCLVRHEDAVLSIAVLTTDRLMCTRRSIRPAACRAAYDTIFRTNHKTWSTR